MKEPSYSEDLNCAMQFAIGQVGCIMVHLVPKSRKIMHEVLILTLFEF